MGRFASDIRIAKPALRLNHPRQHMEVNISVHRQPKPMLVSVQTALLEHLAVTAAWPHAQGASGGAPLTASGPLAAISLVLRTLLAEDTPAP